MSWLVCFTCYITLSAGLFVAVRSGSTLAWQGLFSKSGWLDDLYIRLRWLVWIPNGLIVSLCSGVKVGQNFENESGCNCWNVSVGVLTPVTAVFVVLVLVTVLVVTAVVAVIVGSGGGGGRSCVGGGCDSNIAFLMLMVLWWWFHCSDMLVLVVIVPLFYITGDGMVAVMVWLLWWYGCGVAVLDVDGEVGVLLVVVLVMVLVTGEIFRPFRWVFVLLVGVCVWRFVFHVDCLHESLAVCTCTGPCYGKHSHTCICAHTSMLRENIGRYRMWC